MAKKYQKLGLLLYHLTWPGIWLVIKLQLPRTRVAIISQGQILLTKDWLGSGKWSLPGGGIKFREDPIDGAVREVKEETGLTLEKTKLKFISRDKIKTGGMKVDIFAYYIELKKPIKPKLGNNEIADCQWFKLSELSEIKLGRSAQFVLAALRDKTNLLK